MNKRIHLVVPSMLEVINPPVVAAVTITLNVNAANRTALMIDEFIRLQAIERVTKGDDNDCDGDIDEGMGSRYRWCESFVVNDPMFGDFDTRKVHRLLATDDVPVAPVVDEAIDD